jgi:hypothetical protein
MILRAKMIEMGIKWALMTLGLGQGCGSFILERKQKDLEYCMRSACANDWEIPIYQQRRI